MILEEVIYLTNFVLISNQGASFINFNIKFQYLLGQLSILMLDASKSTSSIWGSSFNDSEMCSTITNIQPCATYAQSCL